MAEISIAILGLMRTGASIGLALKRYNQQNKKHTFTITGFDSTPGQAKESLRMGAVHELASTPEGAARAKDIVIIALPYSEVKAAYQLITHALRPGAVILDMSPLSVTSLEWAKAALGPDIHLVCTKPVVNPDHVFNVRNNTEAAVDTLFDKGTLILMPSATCNQDAIELASEFARILGANPHFLDPYEHDGLAVGADILPALLGIVYFYMQSQKPGWADLQRLTNPSFGAMSYPLFEAHSDDIRELWLSSGDNLVRNIDEVIAQLRVFRQTISQKDTNSLNAALDNASKEFEHWINRRHNNRWEGDEVIDSSSATMGGVMGGMMGNIFGGRKQNKNDTDKK